MNLDKNKFKEVITFGNKAFGFLKLSEAKVADTNIRKEKLSVEETKVIQDTLAKSIKDIGLQQFPVCTPEGEVFIGGRRLKAFELNKEQWIPVEIRDINSYQQRLDSWAENKARMEVEPLSEAQHFKETMQIEKKSAYQLAKDLGLPETYINDRLKVLETLSSTPGVLLQDERGLTREQEKKAVTFTKARDLSRDWVPQKLEKN